jgi:hypothetical protein
MTAGFWHRELRVRPVADPVGWVPKAEQGL